MNTAGIRHLLCKSYLKSIDDTMREKQLEPSVGEARTLKLGDLGNVKILPVLETIAKHGPLNISLLFRKTGLNQTSVDGHVKKLIEKGTDHPHMQTSWVHTSKCPWVYDKSWTLHARIKEDSKTSFKKKNEKDHMFASRFSMHSFFNSPLDSLRMFLSVLA